MPRVRPDDFHELPGWTSDAPAWARWWRHRDGTVDHIHYHADGTVLSVIRHDTEDAFPVGPAPRDSQQTETES
jgi:hypothetical protein